MCRYRGGDIGKDHLVMSDAMSLSKDRNMSVRAVTDFPKFTGGQARNVLHMMCADPSIRRIILDHPQLQQQMIVCLLKPRMNEIKVSDKSMCSVRYVMYLMSVFISYNTALHQQNL